MHALQRAANLVVHDTVSPLRHPIQKVRQFSVSSIRDKASPQTHIPMVRLEQSGKSHTNAGYLFRVESQNKGREEGQMLGGGFRAIYRCFFRRRCKLYRVLGTILYFII